MRAHRHLRVHRPHLKPQDPRAPNRARPPDMSPRDSRSRSVHTWTALSPRSSWSSPTVELRQVTGLGQGQSVGGARPVWSPDGEQIAFGPSVLGSGAFPAVYVVNADGTGQRMIQQLDAEEFSAPSWSSNGRRLLYSDATPPGDRRLWLANIGTDEVRRIGNGALPRWLPDGKRIAYVNAVEGRVPGNSAALTQVVYVMDTQDGRPEEFAEADNAVWSPDGGAVLDRDCGSAAACQRGRLRPTAGGGRRPARLVSRWLSCRLPVGHRYGWPFAGDDDGSRGNGALVRGCRLVADLVSGRVPNGRPGRLSRAEGRCARRGNR